MHFSEFLKKVSELYEENKPLVVFRHPNQTIVQAFWQSSSSLVNFDESDLNNGFVMAPFVKGEQKNVFISAEQQFQAVFNPEKSPMTRSGIARDLVEKGAEFHKNIVAKAIEVIKESEVGKIVISRKIDIPTETIDITIYLERLLEAYPTAFCYLWHHPSIGTWLGATPETLVSIKDVNLSTMALAGTQKFIESSPVHWGNKEREEQQVVTDTIISALELWSEEINASEVTTARAGNLLHLKTAIEARLHRDGLLDFSALVESLHPTPAVCGFPTEKAKKFILENEAYDCKYYTGYLGPIDTTENSAIMYVNLRCMEVLANTIRLYVGGGITKDSDVHAEWEETINKAQTMLKVLG